MKVFLVRHGETTWNAAGRIQGRSNTRLSKLGKWQAKQIALELKKEKIDALYSSPLKRAFDTAKEIAVFHKQPIIKRKELEEIDYGMFEKKTFAQIEKKYFDLWEERRKQKYTFKPRDGESFEEMDKGRVNPFLQELKKKHENQSICIVAHSGTNRIIIGRLLRLPIETMVNIWQPNECYYAVECTDWKCSVFHQCIGEKKPVSGYLSVKDMEFWNKKFS